MPDQNDDQKKKALQQFDAVAQKARVDQEALDKERRLKHSQEQADFESRGAALVAGSDADVAKKKADVQKWRQEQAERKREVELDQKLRKEEAEHLKKRKEEDDAYEAKKRKYFDSLHEVAAKKALQERDEFNQDQELTRTLEELERTTRVEKTRAEMNGTRDKEQVERERVRAREGAERDYRKELVTMQGEYERKKYAIASMGQGPEMESQKRAKLGQLDREMEKKRVDLEGRLRYEKEAIDRDALRKRGDAERKAEKTIQQLSFDADQKKYQLKAEREKTRKKT